jgi:hypothetical protein
VWNLDEEMMACLYEWRLGPIQHVDGPLALELAEHAYLRNEGWHWIPGGKEGVIWIPPPWHRGKELEYTSRQHAVNSAKYHKVDNARAY